jgi:hypothetical protein
MRIRTPATALAIAVAGTALTAVLAPPAQAGRVVATAQATDAAGLSMRLRGTASAGAILADDPGFLVPYADQIVASAVADLYEVRAFAEAQPVQPGTVAALVPTAAAVFCPDCPEAPAPDVVATAESPSTPEDEVAPAPIAAGPLQVQSGRARAEAVAGEKAVALAEANGITGVEAAPGVPIGDTRAHVDLHAPAPGSTGTALSLAGASIGASGFVALARVLPRVEAAVGMQQPDGTIAPISSDGVEVGPTTRLRGSAEADATTARAGLVLEHTTDEGVLVQTTVLAVTMERTAAPAGEEDAAVPAPAGGVLSPPARDNDSDDGAGASGSGADDAFASVRAAPTPSARAAQGDPLVVAARRRVIDKAGWLGWLFAAWLCLGAAATAAGRRWLAPRIAVEAAATRAARAAALDDLDSPS